MTQESRTEFGGKNKTDFKPSYLRQHRALVFAHFIVVWLVEKDDIRDSIKSFIKSRKTKSITFPSFTWQVTLLEKSIKSVREDFPFWIPVDSALSFKCLSAAPSMIFFTFFPSTEVRFTVSWFFPHALVINCSNNFTKAKWSIIQTRLV